MKKCFRWIRAIAGLAIIGANMLVFPILAIILAFFQKTIPIPFVKKALYTVAHKIIPDLWVSINNLAMAVASSTTWEIITKGELKRNSAYFLMCNHQSWLDILVMQRTFLGKIPMLKFFMKQELLWTLPIGGLACYMLDFPFMKRHSKEYLKKHPEQRDKDIETTRRSCEKYKNNPIAIMNFIEGTRFTPEKKSARRSPFRNLLPPKAGGIALVLATMDEHIHHIIDTTIVYHTKKPSLWHFFCGGMPKITVHYEVIPVPGELKGDYYHDKAFRLTFQQWLNQRWQKKDQLIDNIGLSDSNNSD